MKWSASMLWMSVAVVGMLCIPRMSAASGRITFSGAVLESTCPTEEVAVATASRLQPNHAGLNGHLTCGQSSADAGRSYSRTVASLNTATVANDRLLSYFSSYAPVASGTVEMVVRTYN